MKRSKNTPQVHPKDKPKSYWPGPDKQVKDDIRSKLEKSPQQERENKELNKGGLEEDPAK